MKRFEHHPAVSIGLFFIVLGAALLIATNDLLKLGSVSQYFTWETALVFIGVLLLVNLKYVGGIILISVGTWFFLDNSLNLLSPFLRTFYWPAVIIILGISFIVASLAAKRKKYFNQ